MDRAETIDETAQGDGHVSIVVPCYNEEEVLPLFHQRLAAVMDAQPRLSWSVLYVDDGSLDTTRARIVGLAAVFPNVAALFLSRNFGKEAAMTAGLDHVQADAVVIIDADLQDPPEVIPRLLEAWKGGADVAYAQRRERHGESWLKRFTARTFYRSMSRLGDVRLPRDTGDFRIMSRRAVEALLQLREQHRFMKGLFAWVGFAQVAVLYDREPRQAGHSKWNYWKLWNLAVEGITGFSLLPLKVATYLGLLVATLSLLYGFYIFADTLFLGNPVAGYPSLITVVLLLGGLQLVFLGVLGEYVGRIFNEVKDRPLYLVDQLLPARQDKEAAGHGP